ncbi:MAG: LamG domain-containing protein, partial [Phycisphaerae bacterium]|nr:LamG domain-containing protein [Phycisphaerae bacterium]
MSKTLVYLALIALVCGVGTMQAAELNRVAYWDGAHWTNWINEAHSVVLRDALSAAGFTVMDADQLKDFMDARIADGAPSVVVMCRDNGPITVCETIDGNCTFRKYLNAGGKIVWPGDIPFWNVTKPDGTYDNYSDTGSTGILGFYAANGTWDVGGTVTITEAGTTWGLTTPWASVRPAAAASVDIILATDTNGAAAAWVKHYLAHDTSRGLVRTYDSSASTTTIQDIINLANYMEPYNYAIQLSPADGEIITDTAWTLKWRTGDSATSHNVYVTTDLAALNAGQVTPTSSTATTLDLADLVRGTTYYWRVDEIEGANVYEGSVHSFFVLPFTAWGAAPANGATLVRLDQDLSWSAGMDAIFHNVYFGTSYDEVANAVEPTSQSVDPTFDFYLFGIALEAGKTYYWRVDEFAPMGITAGEVWSFSTVPVVPITDTRLVGYWGFDEGVSDTAVDSSGYGHHGILSGDIERTEGYFGGALEFGAGRVVDCGEAALNVTGDFTLAAWVKLSAGNAGVYGGIAGKLHYATNYYGFGIVRHSGNAFRLWVGDGTADLAKSAVSSDVTYTDTDWHHVAGVHSGLANTLYVDGVKQGATTNISFVPSSQFFHIGRQYSSQTDRTFPGLIDEVRVYDKASTDAEIATIMLGNAKLAAAPSPTNGFEVDIRNISELSWSAGTSAVSHDVYLGTDRGAVAEADKSSPEFKGNQTGTTFSVA